MELEEGEEEKDFRGSREVRALIRCDWSNKASVLPREKASLVFTRRGSSSIIMGWFGCRKAEVCCGNGTLFSFAPYIVLKIKACFSNTDPTEGTSPCWEAKVLVFLSTDSRNCALSLLHCHPHSDLCCYLEEGRSAFMCYFCIPDRKIHFYTG